MPRGPEEGEELYVVRLYDGFDHDWMDVSDPMSYEEALKIWNTKTENGTKKTEFDDIDYYDIYPASVRMIFSDGMFDEVFPRSPRIRGNGRGR